MFIYTSTAKYLVREVALLFKGYILTKLIKLLLVRRGVFWIIFPNLCIWFVLYDLLSSSCCLEGLFERIADGMNTFHNVKGGVNQK